MPNQKTATKPEPPKPRKAFYDGIYGSLKVRSAIQYLSARPLDRADFDAVLVLQKLIPPRSSVPCE